MSSENDRAAAPAEAPRKVPEIDSYSDVRETASRSGAAEAYEAMGRKLDSPQRDELTSPSEPSDKSLVATQTADKVEGNDKGVIDLDADGTGKIKYDPSQRLDRMSSSREEKTGDGRVTAREFDGRSDGMNSLVTNDAKGERSETRAYDSSKSRNGIIGEQIVTSTTDGTTSVVRSFDPSKTPRGLLAERIKDTPASRLTDKFFSSDSSNPSSVQSESTTLEKASGAEKKVYQLASGKSIQLDKAGPDAKPVIKYLDANGTQIDAELAPKNGVQPKEAGAIDAPRKPETGETSETKPGADKTQTREQKTEQELAKYREALEKSNKLPPLKAGNGPYQAIQAAIKSGQIPPMSHKEILSEARNIRDRDIAAGHGSYKVGERLERFNKSEMDAKVEAERKRLQQAPEQAKPEQAKVEQPKVEQPKVEQPKVEQPKVEQPKVEQPKAEQPKVEQPKVEQPKVEQPKVEQPKVEQPKVEQPKVEQPKAEQPKQEQLEPRQPGDKAAEKKPGLQVENKGASKEFAEKLQKEVDKLPENVRKALEQSGAKIIVGKTVLEVMPELKDQSPRGHVPGIGWENLDGLHNPATNSIIIAETYMDNGQVRMSERSEGILKHETGHAVDHALGDPTKPNGGDFSQTEEFSKAYSEDVSKITSEQERRDLRYLLTPSGGKSETFAEVFGALNGSSANPSETQKMLEKFPSVAKVIQERLAKLPK